MSVSSEQHTSAEITGKAHIHHQSACASCAEPPAEHDHERETRF